MKITCKHNGQILDNFGFGTKFMNDITELNDETKAKIIKFLKFRDTDEYDFEYGIGGSPTDEYYKVKNISFANNCTEVIVKVRKVK